MYLEDMLDFFSNVFSIFLQEYEFLISFTCINIDHNSPKERMLGSCIEMSVIRNQEINILKDSEILDIINFETLTI